MGGRAGVGGQAGGQVGGQAGGQAGGRACMCVCDHCLTHTHMPFHIYR